MTDIINPIPSATQCEPGCNCHERMRNVLSKAGRNGLAVQAQRRRDSKRLAKLFLQQTQHIPTRKELLRGHLLIDIAKELAVPVWTLSRWVKGQSDLPKYDDGCRLAIALGQPYNVLLAYLLQVRLLWTRKHGRETTRRKP